ncbi:hypothetical protein BRD00_12410 [Halobacteriales archaeon QS_8_69_26]|nr:MAG: hypothetical protein BRD00_12410 [Halobacteriales archaeon QS_8_69_26]
MSPLWVSWTGIGPAFPGFVRPVLQVNLVRLVFPALLSLVGAGLFYIGGGKVLTAKRAASRFEPVEATVLSSRLDEGPDRASRAFAPEVTYKYTYEGEEYTSSTVHPGGTWRTGNRDRMQAIVEEYKTEVGSEVTAYVDPEDPAASYLREGRLRHAYISLGFGVVLLAVGLALAGVVITF